MAPNAMEMGGRLAATRVEAASAPGLDQPPRFMAMEADAVRSAKQNNGQAMDVTIHRLSETWRSRWEGFVEAAPGATLAHAAPWSSVISWAMGDQDRSLVAEREGEVCGILPIRLFSHWLFRTFQVSLPWLDYGGVLADGPETARALLDAATAQAQRDEARFVELRSVDPVFSELPVREDKVTFWLHLKDADGVWKGLDTKARNQVRKAQKSGLVCQFGREALLPEFYRVFSRNMRDLGTPVWDISLFQNILKAFPKTSEIALIRLGDKAIGGGLVLSFKDTVYMPSASSLREYFHLCPNNLLYWEVIKRACDMEYRIFDFGRSTVGSGTYQFKKQWGATPKPLHWQYVLLRGDGMPRLNPSNPQFKVLIEVWKRLPLRIATWLGPRIVRHLP
jgi:FemAB-related protein (PEP-CTERM system-associated)